MGVDGFADLGASAGQDVQNPGRHAREWPLGDPLDPENRVGALVSKAHFDKVCTYLSEGEKVHLGGEAVDGAYVQPTVMDVTDDSKALRDEIFGPVLAVVTVKTWDEA